MDPVAELAALDRPFFTRKEALESGESDRSLAAAVRAGTLVRLRHGAYASASDLVGLEDHERHLLLARAVLAQQIGPVALAGPSAALQRGYAVFGHDLDLVHLVRLDRGAGRHQAGVVHHRISRAGAARVEVCGSVPVVSAEDAVWQVGRLSSLEGAVVTADSAMHRHPALVELLRSFAARMPSQPGSRVARLAIRMARKESESPGESLTRIACFRNQIPCPTLQYKVFDDLGQPLGRSDFYWEQFRLLGEFDGKVKYERLLRPGETASKVVVDEKEREDDMRSTSRGMARFIWSEVQPGATARRMAKLRRELEQSHRLYVRNAA